MGPLDTDNGGCMVTTLAVLIENVRSEKTVIDDLVEYVESLIANQSVDEPLASTLRQCALYYRKSRDIWRRPMLIKKLEEWQQAEIDQKRSL